MSNTTDEKREIFSVLNTKLRIALHNGFYTEAIMLEYAIINDVLSYFLKMADLPWLQNNDQEIPFEEKINMLNEAYRSERLLVHLWTGLINDIEKWNNVRKSLIDKNYNTIYGTQEVMDCAVNGDTLVRRILLSAKNVKRVLGKTARKK